MTETLQDKLQHLKDVFNQIQEGEYCGRPIVTTHDRLLAYSDFETRAKILKGKYLELPAEQASSLLQELEKIETSFRQYGISQAERLHELRKSRASLS
jgi:hypothetical protein